MIEHHKLGQTTVSVTKDAADNAAALVLCGSEIRRLTLVRSSQSMEYSMESIWLTDGRDVSQRAILSKIPTKSL